MRLIKDINSSQIIYGANSISLSRACRGHEARYSGFTSTSWRRASNGRQEAVKSLQEIYDICILLGNVSKVVSEAVKREYNVALVVIMVVSKKK